MNAERLYELAKLLVEQDSQLGIQPLAEQLKQALEALQNSPNDPATQQNASRALDAVDAVVSEFLHSMTPARADAIRAIRGEKWFSSEFVREIRTTLSENPATPAVATAKAQKLVQERKRYLSLLGTLAESLGNVGLEPDDLNESPELGFTIPRNLFDNTLPGLQQELLEISRIIDFFSEATVGKKTDIEVRQISTSDPTFFVSVVMPVAVAIGMSITWLLNTWKQALEIRELVSSAKSKGFSDDELKVFTDRIEKTINEAIDQRVDELIKPNKNQPRDNELRNGLRYAHRALLARIERGLTVEIRFLPPPQQDEVIDEAELNGHDNQDRADRLALAEFAAAMEYPEPSEKPILQIPSRVEKRKGDRTAPDQG